MIKRPLDGFLQSMDEAKSQHMTQKDGYLWGIEYLQDVKKELLKLEERAKSRNDPRFFNDVRSSMLRTLEVEEELEDKIKNYK